MSDKVIEKARDLDVEERTKDVITADYITFNCLMLSPLIYEGLINCGYRKPSPIQLKAIPIGKCGFDLIIKSKSGTGKTAVFTVVTLERLNTSKASLQALILTPTREIAVQVANVIKSIGVAMKDLKVGTFIGGMPLDDDVDKIKNCHVAVGAPGRIRHLLEKKALNPKQISLLILDEADKLMEETFLDDIDTIFESLPLQKQIIASSATYPDDLDEFLSTYMTTPTHVSPEIDSPLLLGLCQFASLVKCNKNVVQMMNVKTTELIRILTHVPFAQCLVFSNYQTRVESISNTLNRQGWDTTHISSAQNQNKRLQTMEKLKNFKCRILFTTDLTSRGIDAANVDLVVNYDLPYDTSTYLHRMGRAGRFGAKGIAISIVSEDEEVGKLKHILAEIGGTELTINVLPKDEINSNLLRCNEGTFEQLKADFQKNNNEIVEERTELVASVLKIKEQKKSKKKKKKKRHSKELNEEVSFTKNENSDNDINEIVNEKSVEINNEFVTENVLDFNIKNVNEFLNSNQKHEENLKNVLEKQDANSLLEAIANNTFKIQKETDSNNVNSDFIKTVVNSSKEETKKRKRINEELKKSSINDRDILYNRNVSLLYITKLLIGTYNEGEIPNEVITQVSNLLTQICFKEEDFKNNHPHLTIENINKYLEEKRSESIANSEKTIEDIFKISYDYLINPENSKHWSAFVPKENKSANEENETSHNRAKKYKKNSSKRNRQNEYSDENEDYDDEEEEYNEDLEYNYEEEGGVYEPNNEDVQTNQNEYSSYNNVENALDGHFVNIYNQHKTKLMKFTESCSNLEEFNEFFKYWQKQLKSSTDYVQQNLYIDVINNYRYYKQYN